MDDTEEDKVGSSQGTHSANVRWDLMVTNIGSQRTAVPQAQKTPGLECIQPARTDIRPATLEQMTECLPSLSSRQREALIGHLQSSNSAIAASQLGMSKQTFTTHLGIARQKLGVEANKEKPLVDLGLAQGWLQLWQHSTWQQLVDKYASLPPHYKRLMQMVVNEKSDKEIARSCRLADHTVPQIKSKIKAVFEAENDIQLTLVMMTINQAHAEGMIATPQPELTLDQRFESLSNQQMQVLQTYLTQPSLEAVAKQMGISSKTVRVHFERARAKLGVTADQYKQLVELGVARGWVQLPPHHLWQQLVDTYEGLSAHDKQIIDFVIHHTRPQEIGDKIHKSPKTVAADKSRIRKALGVENDIQLILMMMAIDKAHAEGMIATPQPELTLDERIQSLSGQQMQVLRSLLVQPSLEAVANHMGISPKSVGTHLARLKVKLGITESGKAGIEKLRELVSETAHNPLSGEASAGAEWAEGNSMGHSQISLHENRSVPNADDAPGNFARLVKASRTRQSQRCH